MLGTGKFGCENCYESFSEKINYLLKNLHGTSKHIGRKPKYIKENKIEVKENKKEENELIELNKKLKKAIKDERYEDAAKIRDEIKNFEKNNEQ